MQPYLFSFLPLSTILLVFYSLDGSAQAYQEGHFQQAKELEAQLSRIRGQRNQYDRNEPYSLEGRSYWDE